MSLGPESDRWRETFPDAEQLIGDDAIEHGPADSYRIAEVPDVPVLILFAVLEAQKTIRLVKIRTVHGPMN